MTLKVWPPIVSVPVLAAPIFAATANDTMPLPVPDVTELIEIHGAFDIADHPHPLVVVNVTDPVPPLAGTFWLLGWIAYVQLTPACAIVTERPAIVRTP